MDLEVGKTKPTDRVGASETHECSAALSTQDHRTLAAQKRRKKQDSTRLVAKGSLAAARLKKKTLTESKRLSAGEGESSSQSHWCVHNYCCAKDDMVYVPLAARRSVLLAAKVGREFIESGARQTYICRGHLIDPTTAVVGINIYRPEEDPSLTGDTAMLTTAGEQWRVGVQSKAMDTTNKRRRSSTSTAAQQTADDMAGSVERRIVELTEKVAQLNRSNVRLLTHIRGFEEKCEGEPPVFGTFDWLMATDDARCIRWGF
jgi:hypothetical protein